MASTANLTDVKTNVSFVPSPAMAGLRAGFDPATRHPALFVFTYNSAGEVTDYKIVAKLDPMSMLVEIFPERLLALGLGYLLNLAEDKGDMKK